MPDMHACIRCDNCAALCPSYLEGSMEGMNARGRLALLRGLSEGDIPPSRVMDERIFSCLLCGACESLCPRGIPITEELYKARKLLKDSDARRRIMGHVFKMACSHSDATSVALRYGLLAASLPLVGSIRPLKALHALEIAPPEGTLKSGDLIYKTPRARGRITVFAGCTVNFLFPYMGYALIRTLNAVGYDVILPKAEVCCGAPLRGFGLEEEACQLAEKNVGVFNALNSDAVISLCPTCVTYIRDEYRQLIGRSIDHAYDISVFMSDKLSILNGWPGISRTHHVVYHDPCHARYHLKAEKEPRQVLQHVGVSLQEPQERGCCGFGGLFRILHQEYSDSILSRRMRNYRSTDMIITSCPNCVLQFRSRVKDRPVRHIIEIMAESIATKEAVSERT